MGASSEINHLHRLPFFKTYLNWSFFRDTQSGLVTNTVTLDEATTRLFEKGLNIMEVASITGHKDLRMLRRYTHLKAEDLARKLV